MRWIGPRRCTPGCSHDRFIAVWIGYVAPGREMRPGTSPTRHAVDHDLLASIRLVQRDHLSRNTLRFIGVAAVATPLDGLDRAAAASLETVE
jgi:hypothetical protein